MLHNTEEIVFLLAYGSAHLHQSYHGMQNTLKHHRDDQVGCCFQRISIGQDNVSSFLFLSLFNNRQIPAFKYGF